MSDKFQFIQDAIESSLALENLFSRESIEESTTNYLEEAIDNPDQWRYDYSAKTHLQQKIHQYQDEYKDQLSSHQATYTQWSESVWRLIPDKDDARLCDKERNAVLGFDSSFYVFDEYVAYLFDDDQLTQLDTKRLASLHQDLLYSVDLVYKNSTETFQAALRQALDNVSLFSSSVHLDEVFALKKQYAVLSILNENMSGVFADFLDEFNQHQSHIKAHFADLIPLVDELKSHLSSETIFHQSSDEAIIELVEDNEQFWDWFHTDEDNEESLSYRLSMNNDLPRLFYRGLNGIFMDEEDEVEVGAYDVYSERYKADYFSNRAIVGASYLDIVDGEDGNPKLFSGFLRPAENPFVLPCNPDTVTDVWERKVANWNNVLEHYNLYQAMCLFDMAGFDNEPYKDDWEDAFGNKQVVELQTYNYTDAQQNDDGQWDKPVKVFTFFDVIQDMGDLIAYQFIVHADFSEDDFRNQDGVIPSFVQETQLIISTNDMKANIQAQGVHDRVYFLDCADIGGGSLSESISTNEKGSIIVAAWNNDPTSYGKSYFKEVRNSGDFDPDDSRIFYSLFQLEKERKEKIESHVRPEQITEYQDWHEKNTEALFAKNRIQEKLPEILGHDAAKHIEVKTLLQLSVDKPHCSLQKGVQGFYVDDDNRAIIVADAFIGREDTAGFIAWHELAHRGISLQGRDEWESWLMKAKSHETVKAIADRFQTSYAQKGIVLSDIQATEEAIADIFAAYKTQDWQQLEERHEIIIQEDFKKPQGYAAQLWQSAKDKIGSLFGRQPEKVSDEQVFAMLGRLEESISQTVSPKSFRLPETSFDLITDKNSDFVRAVDNVKKTREAMGKYIRLGTTPDAWILAGIPQAKISINDHTLRKVMGEYLNLQPHEHAYSHIHNLTPEQLKQLPTQLNEPIAILKSAPTSSNPDGYLVLTELLEKDKKTGEEKFIVAALNLKYDKYDNSLKVIDIPTVFGRDDWQNIRDIQNGLLKYWDKNKGQKYLNAAFALSAPPSYFKTAVLAIDNVKTNEDLIQYQKEKQMQSIEKRDNEAFKAEFAQLDQTNNDLIRQSDFYQNAKELIDTTQNNLQKINHITDKNSQEIARAHSVFIEALKTDFEALIDMGDMQKASERLSDIRLHQEMLDKRLQKEAPNLHLASDVKDNQTLDLFADLPLPNPKKDKNDLSINQPIESVQQKIGTTIQDTTLSVIPQAPEHLREDTAQDGGFVLSAKTETPSKEQKAELKMLNKDLSVAKKTLKALRDEFDSKMGYSFFNKEAKQDEIIRQQLQVLDWQNRYDNLTLEMKTKTGEITPLESEILSARVSGSLKERVSIVLRELSAQKAELRQQYDEISERIKKGEVYAFEIQNVQQQAIAYYSDHHGMATYFHNGKPLPLHTDKDKAVAYLLKVELPHQQFEQYGKPLKALSKKINELKNTQVQSDSHSRLMFHDEIKFFASLETAENQLIKGAIDQRAEINLTYDINTPDGEKKVRELFYGSQYDANQAELFEKVFAMAQKLNVEVRHALRDSGQKSGNTKYDLGVYLLKENSARVKHNGYIKPEQKGEVLLHELVHSVTSRAMFLKEQGHTECLNPAQVKAIEAIEKIYQAVLENAEALGFEQYNHTVMKGDYGLQNTHEFIAELANPVFREKLKQVAVFDDTVKAITEVATGVEKTETAYDRLSKALYQIMDNYDPDFGEKYDKAKIRNIKMFDIKEENHMQEELLNQLDSQDASIRRGAASSEYADEAVLRKAFNDKHWQVREDAMRNTRATPELLHEWYQDADPYDKAIILDNPRIGNKTLIDALSDDNDLRYQALYRADKDANREVLHIAEQNSNPEIAKLASQYVSFYEPKIGNKKDPTWLDANLIREDWEHTLNSFNSMQALNETLTVESNLNQEDLLQLANLHQTKPELREKIENLLNESQLHQAIKDLKQGQYDQFRQPETLSVIASEQSERGNLLNTENEQNLSGSLKELTANNGGLILPENIQNTEFGKEAASVWQSTAENPRKIENTADERSKDILSKHHTYIEALKTDLKDLIKTGDFYKASERLSDIRLNQQVFDERIQKAEIQNSLPEQNPTADKGGIVSSTEHNVQTEIDDEIER